MAMMRARALSLLIAVILLVGAGWLLIGNGLDQLLRATGVAPADPQTASADIGRAAPDFTVLGEDGKEHRLSELRGQVVILNFWATWCGPCRSEMPELERTYQANRDRGLNVIAMNFRETAPEAQAFFKELRLTFPIWLDRTGSVAELYRARGLPSTFVVDRSGIIRFVRVGPVDQTMLENQLATLL
jgi:peroxiredoxin